MLSQPSSERRKYLLSCYGFECACAACSDTDEEDDRLRAKVKEGAERIEKLVYHCHKVKDDDEDEERDTDEGKEVAEKEEEEEEEEEVSEEKVESDLREALQLAEQQLRLMTSLGFKV